MAMSERIDGWQGDSLCMHIIDNSFIPQVDKSGVSLRGNFVLEMPHANSKPRHKHEAMVNFPHTMTPNR